MSWLELNQNVDVAIGAKVGPQRRAKDRQAADVSLAAEDFEFILREGLADPKTVSFESKSKPNWFMINRNGNIWVAQFDGTDAFRKDASWWQKPGLASTDDVSFEAYSQAGAYLFRQKNLLNVKVPGSDADKAAATFIMTEVKD